MYILALNSVYHESSACLLKDGRIVGAVEEERLNRLKHAKQSCIANPHSLPLRSIQYLLDKENITLSEIDYIGYSFNPYKRLQNIDIEDNVELNSWGILSGEELFFSNTIKVKELLSELGFKGIFLWLDHHHCHAASSFFTSPCTEAAVVTIDGIGEIFSTVIYRGNQFKLTEVKSFSYPNSLGFLWEKISQFLGFTEYDACKVMGLCAYGRPDRFLKQFSSFVCIGDNAFSIDNEILNIRNTRFEPLENIFNLKKRNRTDPLLQEHYDIAASLQLITNQIVCSLVQLSMQTTNSKNVCLAGGVALNCVTNSYILEHTDLEELYIPPASHDAGTSVGAVLIIWHEILKMKGRAHVSHTYLGPSFSSKELKFELEKNNIQYTFIDHIEKRAAELLQQGAIIGWFQGALEFGPRALGNRSLIGDPRNKHLRDIINVKVKHREPFRPFAASVLAEEAHKWFHIPKKSLSTDYMLFSFFAKDSCKELIPAVLHVDGSSRIQTVRNEVNEKYYCLIKEFFDLTGVPMLLNTSFNDDEPIVCSPHDAISTFLKTSIDYLILDNFLIERKK